MGGFACAVGKMGEDCADLIPFDCGEGYRRCVKKFCFTNLRFC